MWKKGDMPEQERYRSPEAPAHDDRSQAVPRTGGQATIGRSITIRGEVTGDEDLLIDGRIEGSVTLDQHSITIGPEGKVKANVAARIVTVEGRVDGNLTGEEQVVLRRSSVVQGDIKAPRVVLEDGAQFRGGVQMGEAATKNGRTTPGRTEGRSDAGADKNGAAQPEKPAVAAAATPAAAGARGASAGGKTAELRS